MKKLLWILLLFNSSLYAQDTLIYSSGKIVGTYAGTGPSVILFTSLENETHLVSYTDVKELILSDGTRYNVFNEVKSKIYMSYDPKIALSFIDGQSSVVPLSIDDFNHEQLLDLADKQARGSGVFFGVALGLSIFGGFLSEEPDIALGLSIGGGLSFIVSYGLLISSQRKSIKSAKMYRGYP